jgi:hypothetical protein
VTNGQSEGMIYRHVTILRIRSCTAFNYPTLRITACCLDFDSISFLHVRREGGRPTVSIILDDPFLTSQLSDFPLN